MSNWTGHASSVSVLGFPIERHLVDTDSRRVCPECLREAPYHRAAWLISAMPACARHGARLLRSCPSCGSRLGWTGATVTHCSRPACLMDLREANPVPLAAAELTGVAGLAAMLEGGSHPSGLCFGDALGASLVLGAFRLDLPRWKNWGSLVTKRAEELPAIVSAGWELLSPWPESFRSWLDELASRSALRPAAFGLARAYGRLPQHLAVNSHQPWAAVLLRELADHAIATGAATPRSHIRNWASGSVRPEYLSLNEAARVLGVTADTVTRLAARNKLELGSRGLPGPRHLSAPEVRRLASLGTSAQQLLTKQEVKDLLCVGKATLAGLVQLGLLRPVPSSDRVFHKRQFPRANVEGLLRNLERAAAEAPRLEHPEQWQCELHRCRKGSGVAATVKAALDGRVKLVATLDGAPGLKRFVVARKNAEQGDVARSLPSYGRDHRDRGITQACLRTCEGVPRADQRADDLNTGGCGT